MKKALVFAVATALAHVGVATADTYKIDPDHSEVGFKIRHLTISNVTGNFTQFAGTFQYDPTDVKSSKVQAEITIPSIDTNQKKRDEHLKSPDFFDATKFPVMKFVSKSVEPTGDKSFKATGDLTIRDVTKPVTLDVIYQGAAKDPYGNDRTAFAATTTIDRQDFGLTYNKALEAGGLVVGNEVQISINVEGIKQPAGS